MELIQSHPSVLTLKTDRRDSKGIEILIMSDVHFDNPHCDRELLKKHLDQAKAKGAYVICIGDFFCAMEGRYDPRRSKGTIRPEYNRANYIDCIVNDAIKYLEPYKENLLFFSLGNHETSVLKNVETDLLERMIGGLGGNIKKLGYLGYFIINTHYDGAKVQKYRIFFHHGKWGGVITKGSLAAVRYASISNADLIVSGHCFDDQTEILTPNGWITHDQLSESTVVATMNKTTREMEYQKINSIHKYDNYKELYHVEAEGVDLMTTDKHGLILEKYRTGELIETTMKDFIDHNEVSIMNAVNGEYSEGLAIDDDYLRLVPWVISDGSIEGNAIRFHLKKDRKIKRVIDLLDAAKLNYSVTNQKSGSTKIYIKVDSAQKLISECHLEHKNFHEIYYKANSRQAGIILDEYKYADGNVAKEHDSYVLYSKDLNDLSVLQSMCIKCGLKSTIYKDDGRRGCSRLNVSTRNKTMFERGRYEKRPYDGIVWCVNVDNGTLIVRRNGRVSVTQNTHDHWSMPHAYYDVDGAGQLKVKELDVIKCGTYKEEFESGSGFGAERIVMPKMKRQWWLKLTWNTQDINDVQLTEAR